MSTKSGTSLEIDIATAAKSAESAGSAGLAGLIAKLAELELERITARDKAYSRLKWTDALRPSGSRQ